MEELRALLSVLSDRHRTALSWFFERTGTVQSWPSPLPDGTILATKAKGIYKPVWSRYALTIRQSLQSLYPDREPVVRPDGSWSYFYFQENLDTAARDSEFTNRGLVECWRDKVPVAVMRQVSAKPTSMYKILGLALVAGWGEGYFIFEGFRPDGRSAGRGSADELRRDALSASMAIPDEPTLDSMTDGRERILASIVRRQGQGEFRRRLLEAYDGRCAITGCDVVDALEAAHIVPYRGPGSNHPSNGLLLRADLHTLFDLGLLSINSDDMVVVTVATLATSAYRELSGKQIRLPVIADYRPSKGGLDQHRTWSGL
jgi:putative restriction endonuclease